MPGGFFRAWPPSATIAAMFSEPAYQWRDPAWRRAAEAWIRRHAARLGQPVRGHIGDVRFLPWSAVLRAPTGRGDLYFKACGASQAFEPALAVYLAAAQPDCMIPVLAADPARGRLLMPDGGALLTDAIREPDGPNHWRRVLALLAGVQQAMIPHAADLLALGLPDRRPLVLSGLLATLLERPNRLLIGRPGALTTDDVARLQTLTARVADLAAELAAAGPPDTYVHDDLHEDHIFARPEPGGAWHYTFFDYGDACLTHPFMQLVARPRFAPGRFGIEGDKTMDSLHEDYLLRWGSFASLPALRRALSIALALGGIMRAATWINACGDQADDLSPELRGFYAQGVAFWLRQVRARVEGLDVT